MSRFTAAAADPMPDSPTIAAPSTIAPSDVAAETMTAVHEVLRRLERRALYAESRVDAISTALLLMALLLVAAIAYFALAIRWRRRRRAAADRRLPSRSKDSNDCDNDDRPPKGNDGAKPD